MINFEELLHGQVRRMPRTIRYSSYFVQRGENTAEHSWYVAYFSLIIGRHLQDTAVQVDMGKLLTSAVLHDIEETVTGDITTRVKYGSRKVRDGVEEFAKELVPSLFASTLPDYPSIKDLVVRWEHAKDKETVEGQIVRLADVLSVVSYITDEIAGGNQFVARILRETFLRVKMMRDGFEKSNHDWAFALVDIYDGLLSHIDGLVTKLEAGTIGKYVADLVHKAEEDSRAKMVRTVGTV